MNVLADFNRFNWKRFVINLSQLTCFGFLTIMALCAFVAYSDSDVQYSVFELARYGGRATFFLSILIAFPISFSRSLYFPDPGIDDNDIHERYQKDTEFSTQPLWFKILLCAVVFIGVTVTLSALKYPAHELTVLVPVK